MKKRNPGLKKNSGSKGSLSAKRTLGFKGKILLPVVGIFVVSVAIILTITLNISARNMDRLTGELMEESNMHYASAVQGEVNAAMESMKTMKVLVEALAQEGSHNREKVIDILQKILQENDMLFATYTLWEPNAFDGNDTAYVGTPGTVENGRFATHIFREDGQIRVIPLVGYDADDGSSDWYLLPKQTGKAYFFDPYEDEADGKPTFVTSVVIPIMKNGQFAGIVGADILVDTLMAETKGVQLFDTGYLFMADSQGTLFSHPDESLKGKPVYDFFDTAGANKFKQAMADGTEVSFDSFSELTDTQTHYVIGPVTVGEETWWIGSRVPTKEISKATTTSLLVGILSGVVAIVVISILLILLITRMIRPINKLVDVADKLALGDVNVTAEVKSKDEIGVLGESFNRMIENIRAQALAAERIAEGDMTLSVAVKSENDLLGKKLSELVEKNNEVLSHIAIASDQVASGARQISDSSIALSQGATEQASAIQELTASIEQISAQTRQNAEYANQANDLAETAKSDAERGNGQMGAMLKAMEEINDSSSNISKIIKVIDEIAFQTNILALNAAVEAARAGQHGKGFAVVAEEVRNLAARSANAAQETTDMIESSIQKVEGGTKIANETAEALTKIVTGIDQVAHLVGGIAVASNEQAAGIAQINQGVMQVSQVVQTNSATSEESAAASEELSGQAELLKEQISRYKLKGAAHRSYRAEPRENVEAETDANVGIPASRPKQIALSDNEFGKY